MSRNGGGGILDCLEDDDDEDTVPNLGSVHRYDPKKVSVCKSSSGTWTGRTGMEGDDIDLLMESTEYMEGVDMDSLTVPPTLEDFHEDFEEDEGGNVVAEAAAGGGGGGAGLFWADKEGSFQTSPFTNKFIGAVHPLSSLYYYPEVGVGVSGIDHPMFAMTGQTSPLRDPDDGARENREALELKRGPLSSKAAATAASAANPSPPSYAFLPPCAFLLIKFASPICSPRGPVKNKVPPTARLDNPFRCALGGAPANSLGYRRLSIIPQHQWGKQRQQGQAGCGVGGGRGVNRLLDNKFDSAPGGCTSVQERPRQQQKQEQGQ